VSGPGDSSIRPLEQFVAAPHRDALLAKLPANLPPLVRAVAGLILLVVVATGAMLWLVPWIQTAAGSGQIVALDPADRVQSINALVEGRINRWFVNDGSVVKAGDPIVEITDIDRASSSASRPSGRRSPIASRPRGSRPRRPSSTTLARKTCSTKGSVRARTSKGPRSGTRRCSPTRPAPGRR
jgi:hypothetical protein